MTTSCGMCVDAATSVDATLTETWRHTIKTRTGYWPAGIIAERVCADNTARYVPFERATSGHLTAALMERRDTTEAMGSRTVAAAWWALHLAGRDTAPHAVLNLAELGCVWLTGFLAGQLQPWRPEHDTRPAQPATATA